MPKVVATALTFVHDGLHPVQSNVTVYVNRVSHHSLHLLGAVIAQAVPVEQQVQGHKLSLMVALLRACVCRWVGVCVGRKGTHSTSATIQ